MDEKKPLFCPKRLDIFSMEFSSFYSIKPQDEDKFIPATEKRLHFFKIESKDKVYMTVSKEAKDKLDALYKSRIQIPGLNSFTKNHYDACLIMISMISQFTISKKSEFVPIAYQNFRKVHVNYRDLIHFLKSFSIIETIDHQFTTKIHQLHRNSVTKYKILGAKSCLEAEFTPTQTFNDPKLVKKLIKLNDKFLQYKEVNHGNYDSFTFHSKNFSKINQFLQEDYLKKRQVALSEHKKDLKAGKPSSIKERIKQIQVNLYSTTHAIYNIIDGNVKIVTDEFGYRKHSEYTRIPKELRKLLTHYNSLKHYNDAAEVDIKSSQVSFLVHILPGYFEDNFTLLYQDNPEIYQKKKKSLEKEIEFISKILSQGEFYKYIADEMKLLKVKVTQKEVKSIVFSFIFSKSNNQTKYIIHSKPKVANAFLEVFNRDFKTISNLLTRMKYKDHSVVAKNLQRAESKFMETVSKALTDFKVDKIMIHDSFIIPSNKIQTTENIVKNVIQWMKLPMTISSSVTESTGFKRSKLFSSFKNLTKRQEIIKEMVKAHSYGSPRFTQFTGIVRTSEIVKEEKTPKNSLLREKEYLRGLKATRTTRREQQDKTKPHGTISSPVLCRNLTNLKGYLFLRTKSDFIMELEKDTELLILYTDNIVYQSLLTRFETTEEKLNETMVDILNLEPTLGIYRVLEGDELKFHESRLMFRRKYNRNKKFVPKSSGKLKKSMVKSVNENKVQENNISEPNELRELGYGIESRDRVKSHSGEEREREIDLDGGDQLWFLQ